MNTVYHVLEELSRYEDSLSVVLNDGQTLSNIVEMYRHYLPKGKFALGMSNIHHFNCLKSCTAHKVVRIT